MLRPLSLVAAGLALAIGTATPVAAAVYKWTDSQGRVVYSDQPPPPSVTGAELKAPPPPANPNAAKELAQQEAAYQKRTSDAATAQAAAAKARADEADHAHGCAMAKSTLLQLADGSVPITRYGANGQRETMSDAARTQEQARVTAWMRDNKCPG
ncbi:MAG: DUF4124 domain-containing protein [Proteobacteria bacterium]|jgi:hypothetical protein|nr:DUF4124 domain-containing protein [Pseudomonadota bacterium]